MSELKTEHRGYGICYSENDDLWRCWDLDLEHYTLSGMKNAINRAIQKAAKSQSRAAAWVVGNYGKPMQAVVTAYAGKGYHGGDRSAPQVWVMQDEGGIQKRKKHPAASVMLDTPENRKWLDELNRLTEAARVASKASSDHLKTIPHATIESLTEAGIITDREEDKTGEEGQ